MAGKKIIAVCRSGGEFVSDDSEDGGGLSYRGGNAHAIDIDDQIKFEDFKKEIAEMFSCCSCCTSSRNGNIESIKYLLPLPRTVNDKTLISVSNDKDLTRMVNFHSGLDTLCVYVVFGPDFSSRFSSACRGLGGTIMDDEIRAEFSHHDPGVARINNGSFGSCPGSVLAAQRQWQLRILRQPDNFYHHELQPGLLESRKAIKRLVNADDVDEITVVDNATTAVAIVLQRASWAFSEGRYERGDAAVVLHCAYNAVKKAVAAYFSRAGGRVVEARFRFPVSSNDEIVSGFKVALKEGKSDGRRVRLALIDHVASMPTVVVPVKDLVKLCREEGVEQVFVDGAHGVGCVDVDVKHIGADFYTSNLHKWFFCPPSAAFLHCRSSPTPSDLHHPIVSHEYGNGLAVESGWVGTRDHSPLLVIPSALDFVDRFENGIEGIKKRNHDGVVAMAEMLAKAWGTSLGCPTDMCSSMIMVGLPARLGISSENDTLKLRTHLRADFGVEVPIFYRAPVDGEVGPVTGYARISHQVYNKAEDYHKLRDTINQLVFTGFTCACLPS